MHSLNLHRIYYSCHQKVPSSRDARVRVTERVVGFHNTHDNENSATTTRYIKVKMIQHPYKAHSKSLGSPKTTRHKRWSCNPGSWGYLLAIKAFAALISEDQLTTCCASLRTAYILGLVGTLLRYSGVSFYHFLARSFAFLIMPEIVSIYFANDYPSPSTALSIPLRHVLSSHDCGIPNIR